MKKNNKKFKKKIITISILIIVILIIAVIKIITPNENEENGIETEAIEKRDIAQSIGATGTIQTTDTKDVVSTLTGLKITSVNVKEGDKISEGDVICTFDTTDISENLAILKQSASVAQAQGNLGVQSAQRNLNDAISNKNTQVSTTQEDLNKALEAYQNAEAQLNSAKNDLANKQNILNNYVSTTYNVSLKNFETIESTYKQLENDYNNKTNAYNAQVAAVNNAKIEYDKYFQIVGNVENQLDPVSGIVINPSDYQAGNYATDVHSQVSSAYTQAQNSLASLETALNSATSNYLNYKSTYESALATYTPISEEYQSLAASVATAQSTVSSLEGTVSSLKATYDSGVNSYNSMVSSSDSSIASLQDALTNSELSSSISTSSQESQIRAYEKQLEEGTLKSTVSGTVTSVNVKSGDIYTGTTIAVIEGCEEFIVEAEIDEYDIADIEVGMKVLIKTDATRDEELEGRVIYTAPSATSATTSGVLSMSSTSTSGAATYTVKISLDTQNDRLRLGMNAKLSIITDSKENVWTVPYDAIYEREDESKYIEVLKDKATEEIEELDVKTGLEGIYYVEVISDKLKEGMEVVLPETDTNNSIETLINQMGADAGI